MLHFTFEKTELLGDSKSAEDLFGKDGLLKNLSKRLMERLLEAEMTSHLGYSRHDSEGNNSGNGKTKKTIKTGNGNIDISIPRDRESEFDPIVFIDGFVAKCRLDGRVENRTVYVIFRINLNGKKDVLGLYLGAAEGAKF